MLVGIDIETTGLDELHDGAQILELGIQLRTDDARRVIGTFQATCEIQPDTIISKWSEEHLPELIAECRSSGSPCEEVEQAAIDFLRAARLHPLPFSERPSMFGSSVHFDRRWLAAHMPELHDCFHYRNIDASSLVEWARKQGCDIPTSSNKRHRVIADIESSFRVAQLAWNGGVNGASSLVERLGEALVVQDDASEAIEDLVALIGCIDDGAGET